jgi:hypothetical protein
VHEVDAGHHFEQFTENVVSGTDAARRHVDLAGTDFGIADELGDRLDRHRGVHLYGRVSRATPATGAMSRMKLKLSLS